MPQFIITVTVAPDGTSSEPDGAPWHPDALGRMLRQGDDVLDVDQAAALLGLEPTGWTVASAVARFEPDDDAALGAAARHGLTQLRDLDHHWPERELHEPVADTIRRLEAALGEPADDEDDDLEDDDA